ncbi:unnamed protein product, partial [Ceratitis capitata]
IKIVFANHHLLHLNLKLSVYHAKYCIPIVEKMPKNPRNLMNMSHGLNHQHCQRHRRRRRRRSRQSFKRHNYV